MYEFWSSFFLNKGDKWTSAGTKNAPIEVLIESKEDGKSNIEQDVYSVTQFKKSISLEIEELFVPFLAHSKT